MGKLAGAPFAATFDKLRGGVYPVRMTKKSLSSLHHTHRRAQRTLTAQQSIDAALALAAAASRYHGAPRAPASPEWTLIESHPKPKPHPRAPSPQPQDTAGGAVAASSAVDSPGSASPGPGTGRSTASASALSSASAWNSSGAAGDGADTGEVGRALTRVKPFVAKEREGLSRATATVPPRDPAYTDPARPGTAAFRDRQQQLTEAKAQHARDALHRKVSVSSLRLHLQDMQLQ